MNGALLRGAVAGLAGTAAMSAAMSVAKAAGLMAGEWPPRKVGRESQKAAGVHGALSRPAFEAGWVAQHFAYGAGAGAAYELIQSRLKLREPAPAGPLFGTALWALSYVGWLPAAGLYPPPHAEPARRVGTMVVAHLVYGTTTAEVARRLRPRPDGARGGRKGSARRTPDRLEGARLSY